MNVHETGRQWGIAIALGLAMVFALVGCSSVGTVVRDRWCKIVNDRSITEEEREILRKRFERENGFRPEFDCGLPADQVAGPAE